MAVSVVISTLTSKVAYELTSYAGVAELADAQDLKSCGG